MPCCSIECVAVWWVLFALQAHSEIFFVRHSSTQKVVTWVAVAEKHPLVGHLTHRSAIWRNVGLPFPCLVFCNNLCDCHLTNYLSDTSAQWLGVAGKHLLVGAGSKHIGHAPVQHGGVIGHRQSAFKGPQGLNVVEVPALQHALHSCHILFWKTLGRGFRLSDPYICSFSSVTDHGLACMVFS